MMDLDWTVTNLAIQVVTSALGAHAAAHEHRFGFVGHSLAGLIAGALSGYFLQVSVMTAINGAGNPMPVRGVEIAMVQALTGAVAMFAAGFIRQSLRK
jgi:hypothetical protein